MKTHSSRFLILSAACAGFLFSAAVLAQPAGPGGGGGQGGREKERPHGPPPEAITACKDKKADATCSFTNREGEKMSGTCFTPPPRPDAGGKDGGVRPLACRPANAPRGPEGGKPPKQ